MGAQPQCDEDLVGPEKDPIIVQDPEFSFAPSTPPVGLPPSASTPVHRVRTHRAPNEIARRNSPPSSPEPPVSLLDGRYLLGPQIEFSPLHRCLDIFTKEEFICRISEKKGIKDYMGVHYRLDGHPHINPLVQLIEGESRSYALYGKPAGGDLLAHVRRCRRLTEPRAAHLFRQVAEVVKACHENGVILRELKLRKFVFLQPDRKDLCLETLENAVLLDGDDDSLTYKWGCLAYISPEILRRDQGKYSGRAADMWSLGVILYTMLVGRYPFSDVDRRGVMMKICRGHFVIPDFVSPRAQCLIRSLIRMDPGERLSAEDVLHHPWLSLPPPDDTVLEPRTRRGHHYDQVVPIWEEDYLTY
ncbi:unnamed protein product [Darwinula stevensoni]|uniref:Protein kinase domain-containing protein n=1 Tax=Darwinula stevensoni TaxID=69355 RepID=A0A7R8XA87_9CRUS|nr:unnamed protein product [Darwinula stevensoni]CAG0886435.1 unnamed protein product [Darwinula stevensoni]